MTSRPSSENAEEDPREGTSDDERVSLDPLTPEEALRALLAVKPHDRQEEREGSQGSDPNGS